MKKLLLASVLAIASTTTIAAERTKKQTDEQPVENWGKSTQGKPWNVVCAERHFLTERDPPEGCEWLDL